MTKLTSSAVDILFRGCLVYNREDGRDSKLVEGIRTVFLFDPGKLSEKKEEIVAFLMELPESFREEKGGGWSFIQACMDKDGNHWGEHTHIEQLMTLGMGIDKVEYLLPREMWHALPGCMPYFVIKK